MNKYFIGLLLILTLNSVKAQETDTNESGSWYTLINKFKVAEKFYLLNVAQWRQVDFAATNRILIIMPSANYRFSKSISAGIGYTYLNFSPVGIRPPSLDYESRFWQHITLYATLGKIKTNQRFMLEERWKTSLSKAESYANRFRYRINFDFNLFELSNNKYILGKFSEELRVRFGSGVNAPQFDQNNFAALLGYKILDNSKLYLGYGRNYYKSGDGTYWGDHLLRVNFSYDFDLSKKN